MEKVVLKANVREKSSKSAIKNLRRSGKVPGVFYSKHNKPVIIEVPEGSINPLVFTSEANLISLQIEGHEEYECIIKDIQFDPVTDKVTHFDLLGLSTGEKLQLEVPIQFIGSPIGIKEGGILQQILHKLEIECLPKDIPQRLDVNIHDLKLGDSIHVSDLSFENLSILNPPNTVIVAVVHPKIEKEVVPEAIEEEKAEPEVIGKGKAEKEEEKEE